MINQEEKSNALKLARHAIENDDPTILLVRHHTGISEGYVLTDDEALAFDMLMEAKMGITAIQQGTGDIEDEEKFKALPYPLQQLILEAIEDGKRRMKENGEEHED